MANEQYRGLSIGSGGVTLRNPVRANLDIHRENANYFTAQHEAALEQRSKILSAINSANLNEAEDEWKYDYANRIMSRIDSAAQFGNYAAAKDLTTKLASEAVTSPELLGRIRYNENRNKYLEELKTRHARKEIDSNTYNRAVAENSYNYLDTYNDKGQIVGGTDWNPSFNPVNDINFTDVAKELQSLVTASGTGTGFKGGTSQTYKDAKGNITNDPSQAAAIYSVTQGGGSSSTYTGVTAEQWNDAYNAWVSMHPEATQAFRQKMANDKWNYDQNIIRANDETLSQEDRETALEQAKIANNNLLDDSGAYITNPETYAKRLISPMLKVMEWSKVTSETQASSTLLDDGLLKNKAIAQAAMSVYGLNETQAEIFANGVPIEVIRQNAVENRNNVDRSAKAAAYQLSNAVSGTTYVSPWSTTNTNNTTK